MQVDETLKAFELGSTRASEDRAVIAPPVGYSMKSTYEEPSEASGPGYATASKARATTQAMPGQQWDASGTTLYNPLPSDPRVERILGERRYNERVQEDSTAAMRIRLKEMEDKLAHVTELLSAKVQPQPAGDGDGPVDPPEVAVSADPADPGEPGEKPKYVRPSRRKE